MNIVVLDKFSMGDDTPFDALKSLGDLMIYDKSEGDDIFSRVATADVIITNKVKISAEVIEKSANLKLICVFATGFDNIDTEAAKKRGIGVCNVPGYSTDSVTLFTVSTVLALYSKLYEYNYFVKSGSYTSSGVPNRLIPVVHELSGKTWGIVGYGNIGRAVAAVAKAFGANVIVNKRTPIAEERCVDIDTICVESDIITIHCPLNEQTRNLVDKNRINMMKKEVVLVNMARGAVLNEYDVSTAVKSGRIAGFGCDVYSVEPFTSEHPYSEIMNMPNVILTPHCAWGAYEARERCVKTIANNITAFFEGRIFNRVD